MKRAQRPLTGRKEAARLPCRPGGARSLLVDSQLWVMPKGALVITFSPKSPGAGGGEVGSVQSSRCRGKDAGFILSTEESHWRILVGACALPAVE